MADETTQAKDGVRRGGGPRPLAAPLGSVANRTLGRRGFAEGGLITDWRAVVGAELAASCWPDRISFPPGRKDGGTLRIRVAGGLAIELQHLIPQVLERINAHFGYRAIERISILQAPHGEGRAQRPTARTQPAAPRDLGQQDNLETALAEIGDPEIRAALARLGRAMISDGRTDEGG